MNNKLELKRRWQEKAVWSTGLTIMLYILARYIYQEASYFRIFRLSIIALVFALGTWKSAFKPDVLITNDKMYMFGGLLRKPLIVPIYEIQSVERHSEPPIWRVPPLSFNLKDGSKIAFSTGGDEGRMKRIIRFIEAETALKIDYT